jgi:hypothetical protein
MASVKDVFQKAVKERINGDKDHGWGVEDSLSVIIALVADNAGVEPQDLEADLEFIGAIRSVVNPSAFRQKLESAEILSKEGKTKRKASKLLEGWES